MDFLNELNDAQREAVIYNEGPHLVIAGAGSGKTRVLTYKIAYLMASGVPASSILALTFTNKAAREMKERIGQLVGKEEARYIFAGTFHSIFARILRHHIQLIDDHYTADYTIYDTVDSKSVIRQIVKELQLDDKVYKQGDILGKISDAKNMLMSPREYGMSREIEVRDKLDRMYLMPEIYRRYQQQLRNSNALDFDDILFFMNRLLDEHEDVRKMYQEHFQYLLVDEYQDTNYSQYRIIRHLAQPQLNICVVGDDAQSIYSFRGADIRNILQFQAEYKGCPVFKLERNYRSTQNIVNAANSLIRHNVHQIPKNVYSENGVGEPVMLSSHNNDRDEGKFIAEQIYLHHGKGYSYNKMAVLYRTNAQSRVIEDELRKLSMPYCIYGGVGFYQRKEVKDALSYFRLAVNPSDDEALLRIINFPARKIGDTTIKKIRAKAADMDTTLFDVVANAAAYGLEVNAGTRKTLHDFAVLIGELQEQMNTLNAYEFGTMMMQKTRLRTALAADTTQEGIDRAQNIDELLGALHEFVMLQQEEYPDAPMEELNIQAFLANVALTTDQDKQKSDDSPRVTLMTIHSAKGLEYDILFIAGLEENLFPSSFCEADKDLEEERRLFYVAITRAKEECYITSAQSRFKNGKLECQMPSRFLKDLDSRYVKRAQEHIHRPTFFGTGFSDPQDRDDSWYGGQSRYNDRPSRPTIPTFTTSNNAPSHRNLKPTTGMQEKGEKEPITPPFPIGSRVRHDTFGNGTIKDAYRENQNDKIIIDFDTAGRKCMIIKWAKLEQI